MVMDVTNVIYEKLCKKVQIPNLQSKSRSLLAENKQMYYHEYPTL